MRPEEISALGELAGDAVRGTALQAHSVHDGIARRVWRAVGPMALPVRLVHDTIARGAYRAAGEAGRVLVRGGAGAVALAAPGTGSLEDSAAGRAVVGVLNGAFGDSLRRRGNRLAFPMTLRRDGVDVDPCRLAEAYPEATPRLVVFVHGLGQTDDAWRRRHVPYGFRLQVELGYTPLYIRYNSGRHISENGRELAALLDAVVSGWPVAVDAIALIGHSVGGLVARSACHYGAGLAWAGRLRQVVSLGAPHGGAPLERVTAAAGAVLTRLPETRPVAGLLEARSAGIKDLRDPHEVPFLATADYYFVSAGAPVGRDSAWAHPAPGEPMRFPVDHYREVHGIGYFDLLDHPAVYAVIREWLGGGRPALPAPPASLPPGQRP